MKVGLLLNKDVKDLPNLNNNFKIQRNKLNVQYIEIPNIECKKNEKFIYDKNSNQFKCEKCLFKSNRGKDLIIKQWDNNIYNKYNIEIK